MKKHTSTFYCTRRRGKKRPTSSLVYNYSRSSRPTTLSEQNNKKKGWQRCHLNLKRLTESQFPSNVSAKHRKQHPTRGLVMCDLKQNSNGKNSRKKPAPGAHGDRKPYVSFPALSAIKHVVASSNLVNAASCINICPDMFVIVLWNKLFHCLEHPTRWCGMPNKMYNIGGIKLLTTIIFIVSWIF